MPRKSGGRTGFTSTRSTYGSRASSYSSRTSGYGAKPYTRTTSYAGYAKTGAPVYVNERTSSPIKNTDRSGAGSALAQGMALGAGSSIAHNTIGSLMSGSRYGDAYQPGYTPVDDNGPIDRVENSTNFAKKENPCLEYNLKFVNCLKNNNGDISKCQNLFDDLKVCENNLM